MSSPKTQNISANRALWRRATLPCELAFLRNPLERLGRALDSVLAIIALGRKLADHLIGAARSRTRNVAGSEIHRRPDRKFVLQRPLHHTESRSRCQSRCTSGWKPGPGL